MANRIEMILQFWAAPPPHSPKMKTLHAIDLNFLISLMPLHNIE